VYKTDRYINERKRIVFTRFSLSSHHLKIETGRWSRIVREERLCECGEIQDENHIIFDCPKTNDIRERYNVNNQVYQGISDVMDKHDTLELIDFIDMCMSRF
jgi:hypothetical protein